MGNMRWFRWYRGTCTDPKLGGIAHKCGQPKPVVIAVWALCLESACENHDTGEMLITPEDIAATLMIAEEDALAILDCMRQRGMIDDGHVAAWGKRQFASDNINERVRQHRERKSKQPKSVTGNAQVTRGNVTKSKGNVTVTPMKQNVTPPDSDSDSDTDTETSKATASAPAPADAAPEPPPAKPDKAAKPLTPQQQAIETAWAAHDLGPLPSKLPGYSGLVALVQEHGVPEVLRWAEHVEREQFRLPEGAEPWRHFGQRLRAAMKQPWNWDGSRTRGSPRCKTIPVADTEHEEGVLQWPE